MTASREVAVRDTTPSRSAGPSYRTRGIPGSVDTSYTEPPEVSGGSGGPSFTARWGARLPATRRTGGRLGSQRIIIMCWFAAMGIICYDEWKQNGILARPARLWWTSLFYGLLALAGFIDALIPLLNVIAIGYTIMLAWQYFNREGQFAVSGGSGGGSGSGSSGGGGGGRKGLVR